MSSLLLGMALASSSAHASPRITAEVVGLEEVTLSRQGVEFSVQVELTHERGVPLVFRSLQADIWLGESSVGTLSTDQRTRLAMGDTQVVTIPVRVSGLSVMSALMGGDMDLRVQGEAKVRALIIPLTLDFDAPITDVDELQMR